MDNKELTDRLEIILGCLIGSHTSNLTGEDQLADLITELRAANNGYIVSKSPCVHEPMSFGNIVICTVCDEIL